ncbi:hypothetical protein [Yoonia sp. SS1-5]|uniref:Nitrogen fixation protein n=1 Tax=Yoonia rhodophyticola TaxID=3137370 RepID=A0ABZ3JBK5_9RHOB
MLLTCPIAPCAPGAKLLGIQRPDGRLLLMHKAAIVDATFDDDARALGPPEDRMRFASACHPSECQHWDGKTCNALSGQGVQPCADANIKDPPPCPIRSTCRWFRQDGSKACGACQKCFTKR